MGDTIKIATNFSIQATQYANQGNNIFGIRGFGKTYLAEKIAEGLLDARIPIIVIDPMGVWKNLKTGTGKNKGYEVVVVGGREPDLPLTESGISDIVRASLRENISLIIDLFSKETASKSSWIRIVQKVIEIVLYENGDTGVHRHIFMEEAHQLIPQVLQKQHNLIFSEFEKMALMGRNERLGYTLLSQRAENVNKSITENSELNFVMNQGGKNSLSSYDKWLKLRNESTREEMMNTLPKLKPGEAWVFGVMEDPKRIKVLPKKTFHPDTRAKVVVSEMKVHTADVSKFVQQLKKSLEKEKVNKSDVKLKAGTLTVGKPVDKLLFGKSYGLPGIIDKGYSEKQVKDITDKVKREAEVKIFERDKEIKRLRGLLLKIMSMANIEAVNLGDSALTVKVGPLRDQIKSNVTKYSAPSTGNITEGSGYLSGAWLRMLQAVKMFCPVPVSKEKVSFWSDVAINKSTFKNGLSFLKSNGFIKKAEGNIVITERGFEAAGDVEAIPKDVNAMLELWFNKLGPSWAGMLKVVLGSWPGDVHVSQISELSGVPRHVSTFKNGMSRLRTLNLIYQTVKDRYRVSGELMS